MSERGRIPSVVGSPLDGKFTDPEFRLLAVQLVAEFGTASSNEIRDACCAAADAVPKFSARQIFLTYARSMLTASLRTNVSD